MIKSRKCQLAIVVIIACITASVIGQEPNLAKAKLQFEIGREEQKWITDLDEMGPYEKQQKQEMYPGGRIEKSVIRPTHVAVMRIKHVRVPRIYWTDISNNPIGRTMSKRQKEFIAEANGRIRDLHRIEEGFEFRWYAVSQEDAKKMTQAFIDVWNTKVHPKLQPLLKRRKELEEKIADIKKKLPEKEGKLEAAEANYENVKNITHEFSSESEAVKESKQTILEMIKKLDALEIELAGIREKLEAIEQYRRSKHVPGKDLSDETLEKLDQMLVEQMIELRGAEARKKAALQIRKREKEFYNLYSQLNELRREVSGLNRSLINNERNLLEIEEKLANPTPDMLPPKVYQNKVTIYPVKVED